LEFVAALHLRCMHRRNRTGQNTCEAEEEEEEEEEERSLL
jgi:hypothetical protein